MDKGIRPYVNNRFVELNEQRRRGEMTNTAFRKSVMADAMELFAITLASAATHYNHAFKTVKELNSELVDGLGRAEDKKGGRKPKAKLELVGPVKPAVLFFDELATPVAPAEPVVAEVAPQLVTLVRAKDGTIVAEGLTQEQADAIIAKAVAQKKGKLVIAE